MTISPTPFLAEIAAGCSGPPIPASKRAYFQQRLRNRVFNFLLERFISAQKEGMSKASLARRIGKTPDIINRWLGAPTNLTLDSLSDLLLGIGGEEVELQSSSPLAPTVLRNYSHASDLTAREEIASSTEPQRGSFDNALKAEMIDYGQKNAMSSIGLQ
jgi:hypothetical protein